MSFYAHWQPLTDENAHTAMAFGFLRHAPPEHALNPWLSSVLERPVTAKPLEPTDFWPRYPSLIEGAAWTEPELVVEADDGATLMVVIEAKPGYGQQRREQIAREVLDTASALNVNRVACVMVGADLGPPTSTDEWKSHVEHLLEEHGLRGVECELRYGSWASLGKRALACAEAAPEWQPYAEDVVGQLRLNALMGYDGAPALDQFEGKLDLVNAVETFNLIVAVAREFWLALHGATGFQELGLQPYDRHHRILRDGLSSAPAQATDYFATTVLLSLYRRPAWDPEQVVLVAFDLLANDEPALQVGAGRLSAEGETVVYRWAHADEPVEDLADPSLRRGLQHFPHQATYDPGAEWIYDESPWRPGQAQEDIEWVISRLSAACGVWNSDGDRGGQEQSRGDQ